MTTSATPIQQHIRATGENISNARFDALYDAALETEVALAAAQAEIAALREDAERVNADR